MHLTFLELSQAERSLYFQEAAIRRGLNSVILEKDFWVCWLLGMLFGHEKFKGELVFKGGTSLSKVFNVIQRFSEDIDLSVSPSFLGIVEDDVENAKSRTQRDRWMQRLEEGCTRAIQNQLQPELELVIREVLGFKKDGKSWIEFVLDPVSQSPVLQFHYPTIQAEGFPYLRRMVKMEFGSLTDQRPTDRHPIKPWVAEEVPGSFGDWHCEVVALEVERTFWEKATILHAEHYRAAGDRMPDRFSRHYADMAALAKHPRSQGAAVRDDLRKRVVDWKSRFFARSWARYDLAQPGTFRLVPSSSREADLEADYGAMRDMYLTDPVPFAEVIETIAELEKKINEKHLPSK